LANVVNWPVAEVAMPAQEFVDDTFSKFETVDLGKLRELEGNLQGSNFFFFSFLI
jgi:hypothetical protein